MLTRGCLLFASVAVSCGPAAEPLEAPRPEMPADAGPRPTKAQKRALANPLHDAHLNADEPVACRACHRIRGRQRPTAGARHRCLTCHEDHRSRVHAKVANDEARECLTCHEFLAAKVDPWACGDCHVATVQPAGRSSGNGRHARATAIAALRKRAKTVGVHVKDCDRCHAPHGEAALKPESCLPCHEGQAARHASAKTTSPSSLTEPTQCLECHGGHEAATGAGRACLRCHADERRPNTIFKGHDRCVTCHRPHTTSGKKTCESCHGQQRTIGAEAHRAHSRCSNCHRPHDVEQGMQHRCRSCHAEQASAATESHPPEPETGACEGCHPQHPVDGQLVTVEACASCHEIASSDNALHAGTACKSCHLPHDFDLEGTGAKLCLACHVGSTPKHPTSQPLKRVAPIRAHQNCLECHTTGHHEPERDKTPCGQCHDSQRAQASAGHSSCADCHQPHDGTVHKSCADCHETKVAAGRHRPSAAECRRCHGSHDAPPRRAPTCESCHEPPLPRLHEIPEHSRCADCHQFHEAGRGGTRASCLKGCHQDLVDHEPQARRCIGCHPFEAPKGIWR